MTKIIENPKAEEERTTLTPGNPWRLTVRGYVIWSSTSCGLRPDQSVKTITWLSLKSGRASIGARSIAHKPQPAIPIQSATTRKRLRSESSMSRSIMCSFQRRPSRDPAVQNIYGRMHTSLPPNRQAEERHQETQLRRELQKRIRLGGRSRACITREANAAEPQNQDGTVLDTNSPGWMPEFLKPQSRSHGASHAQPAGRSLTALKPFLCSNHGSDRTDRTAWSHSTGCSAGPASLRTCSPQIASPTRQQSTRL